DVVALARLVHVGVGHLPAGEILHPRERLENGAGVLAPAAEVVDFAASARVAPDRLDGARDVVAVNVVANLLPLVPEDAVRPPAELAADEVRKEAVQFDAGVVR